MDLKRFILSAALVFVGMYAYDMLVHGHLLTSMYDQTPYLWRPMQEMEQMLVWCILYHAALAAVVSYIFIQNYENRGIGEGVRFGVYVGLIMGLVMFASYIYMPVSMDLALAWLVAGVAQGVVAGVILSFTYKPVAQTKTRKK